MVPHLKLFILTASTMIPKTLIIIAKRRLLRQQDLYNKSGVTRTQNWVVWKGNWVTRTQNWVAWKGNWVAWTQNWVL